MNAGCPIILILSPIHLRLRYRVLEIYPLNMPRSHRIVRQFHHHNVCGGLDGVGVMLAVCALLIIMASSVVGQDFGLGTLSLPT
jgi:hypothetical protein